MEYGDIFSFGIKWNYKTVLLFTSLLLLPNFLGMINITTVFGFKIHFFQLAIFLAAMLYGPSGGLFSGMVGSIYSAMITGNPYIVGGNMILGFFVGYFSRIGINQIISVLLAFLIQLPWLIVTDYYLMHLPVKFISGLIAALFVSNVIWGAISHHITKPMAYSLK